MKPGPLLFRLLAVLIGSLLLAACGKKTAPMPPQAVIPAPITGVEYRLDENGVTLSWPRPLRTDRGEKLARIDSFIVERAEYPLGDFCRDCPVRYHQVATVSGAEQVGGAKGPSYRDQELRPGYIYFYRVLTRMGWRLTSLPSQPVSFSWQLPLAPVIGLKADSGDQEVSLSWQPPSTGLDGAPIIEAVQYQVFRSVAADRFLALDNPLTEPYFKDERLTNGVVYRYKVRAARLSGGTGAFSSEVKGMPRDLTPPPAPQGLDTVATPTGIRLFWEPVVAADLAGYQIFRRSADGEAKLLATVSASQSSFVDQAPGEQQSYYKIRAFDRAVPANQSPFSEETRTGR
jgi:hypothetical protein